MDKMWKRRLMRLLPLQQIQTLYPFSQRNWWRESKWKRTIPDPEMGGDIRNGDRADVPVNYCRA